MKPLPEGNFMRGLCYAMLGGSVLWAILFTALWLIEPLLG